MEDCVKIISHVSRVKDAAYASLLELMTVGLVEVRSKRNCKKSQLWFSKQLAHELRRSVRKSESS